MLRFLDEQTSFLRNDLSQCMQPLFQSTSKERDLVSVACYNDLSLNDQGRHAIIHIMFHDSD